jgi:hypothetical protein
MALPLESLDRASRVLSLNPTHAAQSAITGTMPAAIAMSSILLQFYARKKWIVNTTCSAKPGNRRSPPIRLPNSDLPEFRSD